MSMYSDIKRFLGHSAIYFIGNFLNRLGIFLLLPIYTNYLTPEEYGTIELVFVAIAILRVFLGMRLSHATLRFYFEYETVDDRKKLISSSMISGIFWCFFLLLLLLYFSENLSLLFFKDMSYKNLLLLGFVIMFFEVSSEVPIAYLRAKEHSIFYVMTSLLQLLLRIILNIYLIVYLERGITGILLGNLISAIIFWGCLFGFTFWNSGLRLDFSKVIAIWKYSYPLVLASLPALAIKNSDRIFLTWYASLEVVGLYALAIRFGMALRSFILEPFQLNFGSFRFSIMKQDNAKEINSRMLTYFVYIVSFVGLFLTLFSREVIEVMASKSFMEVYKVVPLIIVTTIINGAVYILQTGILVEKKTYYVSYISIVTALFNVMLLSILVPSIGIYGAALSLLFASLIEMVLTYRISQKIYPVAFEYRRIVKIVGVVIFIYFISTLTNRMDFLERLSIKSFFIIAFPLLLIPCKFYRWEEREMIIKFKEKISIRFFSAVGSIGGRHDS